jgi:hypothetical protein
MDPGTAMILASVISAGGGALFGSGSKQGSTLSKGQRGGINDILQAIKGMKGGAQDITQNQGYQQGNEWLSNLFNDPDFFRSFEAPLMRQYEEEIIPGLANRFASMGSGGSTGSTAFRNQLAREGSNLSTNIAALRGGMQQQGVNQSLQYAQQPFQNLMSMYGQALGQPVNNQYQPPSAGMGALAAPFAQGAAAYYGAGGGQGGGNPMAGAGGRVIGQYPGTY